MTGKLFTAVFFVLLTFTLVPQEAMAAVSQSQDALLLVKKKKLETQQKADVERMRAKLAADKLAADRARQKAAMLKETSLAPRRACSSFLQCLFGARHRAAANSAGLAGTGGDEVSGGEAGGGLCGRQPMGPGHVSEGRRHLGPAPSPGP